MNRAILQRSMGVVIAVTMLGNCCAQAQQDVVTIRGPEGDLRQRLGTVIDVTGEQVVLQSGGREQKIPFDQVVEIRTVLDPLAESADQSYAERKYEIAYEQYGQGIEASTPAWMRRRLLAGRVRCATQMKAWVQATDDFLTLLRTDPQTQYFGVIPLVWTPDHSDSNAAAKIPAWLASTHRIEKLIGASHGLAGPHRAAALQVLAELTRDPDLRIAALAAAQQWRAEPRPTPEQLNQWESQLDQMDPSLRGGAAYVLGNAWIVHDRQRAVLHLLKVPVLFGDQFELAARALAASGDQLVKLNQVDSARIVYQELVDRHRGSAAADAAAEALKGLWSQPRPAQHP